MNVTNDWDIGTHFKKENVYLATIFKYDNNSSANKIGKDFKGLRSVISSKKNKCSKYADVFYKDNKGYTRFLESGPETFVGDNSDGKGIIGNIIPIWKYYSEDQVFECLVNDEFKAICVTDMSPLNKYDEDYNMH